MVIEKCEEYVSPNGHTVSIQHNVTRGKWQVACWNEDSTNHWYIEFTDEDAARKEYERWRS